MAKTNQQIIVTEGDFGVEILTQFIDTNKKPVPIEGCSCKVKFAYDGNVITEKTGVVIDEPKGIVSVILDKEETQYSGLWTSYWICYDQFNNITTTENIYYYVQPAIGSVNNPAFTELLNYYSKDEVNNMFKNILEQLNNYTLSKDDVEEYIKIYVQDKIDDDFIRQCILDAIGNASDYAKKQDVTAVSNNLDALSQRVDRYNNSLEQEDIKINTKINTNIETVNTKFESINARIDTSLHNITTNRDSINEIRTKMVTREDINSITRFDITEINSLLKVNEAFNNTKVLLSNGIVNFNCRLEDKTSHNNIPFNQSLFKIPIEFLPNCSYMFLDCKYGLFGKYPTFSGTVKIDCETGTAMLETDGNIIDSASISYIGAITIQATWYIDRNIGTGYKLITQNSNSRISYQLNQTLDKDNFIYYTYMNSDGYNVIDKCNHSGDILETKVFDDLTTDNHGILSLTIDKNGYIHLMGGGHSDFNNYYYRSTSPYSVSEFLKIHLSDSRKTYCHIFAHEDKILGAYRETIEANTTKDRIVYFEAPINVTSLEGFKYTPLTAIKDDIQPSYPFNVYCDEGGIFINFGWYLKSQDKTPKILSVYKNHNNTLWKKVGGEEVAIPVDDTLYSVVGDDLCSTSWIKDGNKYICLFFDRNIGQVTLRTFDSNTISDKSILENQTLLPLNIVRYKGYVLSFVYDLADNYSYLIATNNSFETYRKICLFETGYTQWWNTISTTNQESNTMIPYLSLYNLSKLWLNIVEEK